MMVYLLGPLIIDGFIKGDNPDVICHALKLCHDTAGQPKCRIYPSNSTLSVPQRAFNLRRHHPLVDFNLAKSKICDFPGIKEICKIIENIFNNHLPSTDFDHDKFGTETTLRGGSWRGRDCDDFSAAIHPGSRAVQGDSVLDHNCNGILGMDSATGRAWEDEFCNDTQRLGIAVLGDSISAHFHIPEQWLDAREFSIATFEHLAFILENELDWPQMSGTTGHVNVSWPNIEGQLTLFFIILPEYIDMTWFCRTNSITLWSSLCT
jgi:acyloxyacyl hydrolase